MLLQSTAWSRSLIILTRAIKTPQILELSGVGNPKVLDKVGVQCLVDLPPVGENVQGSFQLEPAVLLC